MPPNKALQPTRLSLGVGHFTKGSGMTTLSVIGLWVLTLIFGLAAFGQNGASSKPQNQAPKHHAEFISVYDKAKDQTVVVMQWYGVSWPSDTDIYNRGAALERAQYDLDIQAAFCYPGDSIKSLPPYVQFEVRVRHPGKSFFKATAMPELKADVDRELISLGTTSLVKAKTFVDVDVGQVSYEHLSVYFTYQGLLRLTQAKNVTMSAGDLTFSLKDHHLEALRDLASRMSP
jgi:hypothetical protein